MNKSKKVILKTVSYISYDWDNVFSINKIFNKDNNKIEYYKMNKNKDDNVEEKMNIKNTLFHLLSKEINKFVFSINWKMKTKNDFYNSLMKFVKFFLLEDIDENLINKDIKNKINSLQKIERVDKDWYNNISMNFISNDWLKKEIQITKKDYNLPELSSSTFYLYLTTAIIEYLFNIDK